MRSLTSKILFFLRRWFLLFFVFYEVGWEGWRKYTFSAFCVSCVAPRVCNERCCIYKVGKGDRQSQLSSSLLPSHFAGVRNVL